MTKKYLLLTILLCNFLFAAEPFFLNDSSDTPFDSLSTMNDTTTTGDTSTIVTDSLAVKRDTLRPILYRSYTGDLASAKKMIREDIERSDYRFTGGLVNYLPFGFLRDLGSAGQPSEPFLYGLGNGFINYMKDGIPVNSRFQNTLDMNLMQAESIDSMEVMSFPSAFFYNTTNQPVSLNFITRDKVDTKPYTRLRFYQGPENEAMIDGLFSAYLMNRLNASFRFTNQSVDSSYKNSSLSNWQLNSRVRYMLSNTVNFIATYDYSKLDMDLNGGVDFETIRSSYTPAEYNEILFNNIQAPVNFENRYHKTTRHNFTLKTLLNLSEFSYTDITLYHQYYLDEFRQDEHEQSQFISSIVNNNSNKTRGIQIRQSFDISFTNIQFLGGFENTEYNLDMEDYYSTRDISYYGVKADFNLLEGKFIPSLFVKKVSDTGGYSLGGEINIKLSGALNLFAGYSDVKRNSFSFFNETGIEQSYKPLEAGIKFDYNWLKGTASFINLSYQNYRFAYTEEFNDTLMQASVTGYDYSNEKYSAANLDVSVHFWKFLLNVNHSYYFDMTPRIENNIPFITSFGGIYYVDTLFNSNLDLKAGINYKFYGQRDYLNYDFQRLQPIYFTSGGTGLTRLNSDLINPDFQLDLFVSGKIRKRATVFLVFENLLDAQYYIVPYYPMQPRGLRLGLTWEFID